ncbi:LOB domain-containing protein CRL1-like [Curcuma longa]|uniref:LOB domain-containing protein CRL1-like n=1 Tax=Curcuma longa TaxID=136217 RepID=UPI003D9E2D69
MTGFGSPCGACKFLRRKCVRGCVFAPYFCHEQGATHFAAIHKVFGASNASKLLMHLPVSDRSEAALTISYEAQARLQDPIYGCVAHIFALQQQVVTLEAQLASLKAQTAQGLACGYSMTSILEDEKLNQKQPPYQLGHGFNLNGEGRITQPLISGSFSNQEAMLHFENGVISPNSFPSTQCYDQLSYMDSDHTSFIDDNSSCAMASLDIEANARRSSYLEMEDLQSVAFGHLNCA